MPPLRVTVI